MTLLDNTAGTIVHPSVVNGANLWIDPAVQDIVDRLQKGDPTLGWEGDPALALYVGAGGRWVVNRFENGTYHTVCRSRPGLLLDRGLIKHLIEHDSHRKTALKMHEEIEKHNTAVEKAAVGKGNERLAEAMKKVYWGAAKDMGVVTATKVY